MIALVQVTGDHFVDASGGREPHFIRYVEDGKTIYAHESGYGYLPADRVVIVTDVA